MSSADGSFPLTGPPVLRGSAPLMVRSWAGWSEPAVRRVQRSSGIDQAWTATQSLLAQICEIPSVSGVRVEKRVVEVETALLVAVVWSAPESGHELALAPFDKCILVLTADLDEHDVGETSLGKLTYSLDEGIDVITAWD